MLLKKDLYFHSIALCAVLFSLSSCAMEQVDQKIITTDRTQPFAGFTKNIVRTVVLPYLSLQEMGRFGRTSTVYKKVFNPAKISKAMRGCSQLEEDYYRCSHALGRFAVHQNEKMFNYFFQFDRGTRHNDIIRVYKIELFDDKTRMQFYRKYYSTSEDVEQRMVECVRNAIQEKDFETLSIINYNIFKVFGLYERDEAFKNLCKICLENQDVDPLIKLVPQCNGWKKNYAVRRICKYDSKDGSLLRLLLRKNFLNNSDSYGNGCTLLHYAALGGFRSLVVLLIRQGADKSAKNEWKKTPMHYSCHFYPSMLDEFNYSFCGEVLKKSYAWKTPVKLEEAIWIRTSSHHVDY